MNFPRWAVQRPVAVSICVLASLILGWLSITRLNFELLPRFSLPYAVVATIYPNADPTAVEHDVTSVVEATISSASGVRRIESLSVENASFVTVEFEWGTDVAPALEDIRSRLSAASFLLPSDIQPPAVLPINPSQLPAMIISLQGDDLLELTDVALRYVRPRIEQIPGVGQASVLGGSEREIAVLYDSERLRANDLTPAWLHQIIMLQHVTVPAGVLESDGMRYSTRVGRPLETVDELAELIIAERKQRQETYGLGSLVPQVVHLQDVADVFETTVSRSGIIHINGEPGIIMRVMPQTGANAVDISEQVRDALAELEAAHPGLRVSIFHDQADTILDSLHNLTVFGIIGGVLAALVLVVFIRNVQALLIIASAIPLSVMMTLTGLYAGGMTLNVMTLGGLALAIGMLLDNAIIVLENIYRLRQQGHDGAEAALLGTQEVTPAIISLTVTTLVVFLPVFFVKGLVGSLFRDLGITVSIALAASLLVSTVVVPALGARLFRKDASFEAGERWWARVTDRYRAALGWCLDRAKLVLAASAIAILVTVKLWAGLEGEFLPASQHAGIYLQVDAPPGTPLSETMKRIEPFEQRLLAVPGVRNVLLQAGDPGTTDIAAVLAGARADTAFLNISIDPDRRDRSTASVLEDIMRIAADVEGLDVRPVPDQLLGPVGDTLTNELIVRVTGPDIDELAQLVGDIRDELQALDMFADIQVSPRPEPPQLLVDIHRGRSLLGGLTMGQIGLAVRHAITGEEVATLRIDNVPVPVRVQPHPRELADVDSLMDFRVSSPVPMLNGQTPPVRLSNVSEAVLTPGSPGIRRTNGQRTMEVRAALGELDSRKTKETVANVIDHKLSLPLGYDVTLAGAHAIVEDTFRDLGFALVLALIAVYMVLAARYESWVHPLIIMTGAPLGAAGAVVSLHLAGVRLGATALLGLIMLGGLVVNNGIVLLDYIDGLRARNVSLRDAVIGGSAIRLRPILMTAVTTLLGLLPLAVMTLPGTEIQRPMAVAVAGGLFSSTVLTLFVVPCLYALLARHTAPDRGRRTPLTAQGPHGGTIGSILLIVGIGLLLSSSAASAADVPAEASSASPVVSLDHGPDLTSMNNSGDTTVRYRLYNPLHPEAEPSQASRLGVWTDWFRPISFVGYREVKGGFLLHRTGTEEAHAFSLHSRNVLGNIEANWGVSYVDGDLGIMNLHTAPQFSFMRPTGMYRVHGELRESRTPGRVWVRDAIFSQPVDTRGEGQLDLGQGNLLITSGSEIRTGSSWIIGKAGVLVIGDEILPVVRAGARLRSPSGGRIELGVSNATEYSKLPAIDLRFQGAGNAPLFTTLRAEYDSDSRIHPSVFVGLDPSNGGTGWQFMIRGSERYMLGVTTSF